MRVVTVGQLRGLGFVRRPSRRWSAARVVAMVVVTVAANGFSTVASAGVVRGAAKRGRRVSVANGIPAQIQATVAVASTQPSSSKPNVLFVLADDMRFDDLQFMPNVRQLIAAQGMSFDNQFDNVTLCCPARTSILRGQYSHNTGVLTNDAVNGGFETAYSKHLEQSTIATAMHGAGYTTALFGKYLNGYPNTATTSYIPPGWDAWASSTKGNAYGEYDYTLNQNGQPAVHLHAPGDYGTDVYVGLAESFITQAAKAAKPFFVYLAVYAPHQPATPAPGDARLFPRLQVPRGPAFNEADVTDKPQYISQRALLTAAQQDQVDVLYRRRARSLQAVDRGVAALVEQLRVNGQLANTYIIFTSDNGFHLGQHRLPAGKSTAFETDIHLPFVVRGPDVTPRSHVFAITGNIDLSPTIAALGGTALADNPDGRSLVPFLTGHAQTLTGPTGAWRHAYLLEHWNDTSTAGPRPDASQLEPDDPDQGGDVAPETQEAATAPAATPAAAGKQRLQIPEFAGLRTAAFTYVEYVTGEHELYDLRTDPLELTNIASSAKPALIDVFHQRLAELRTCAASACRASEDKPLNLP